MRIILFVIAICFCSRLAYAQCSDAIAPTPAMGWGTNGRPPTECEILFYRKYHPLLLGAFEGLESHYKDNWQETYHPLAESGMVTMMDRDNRYHLEIGVGPGSEKGFFRDMGVMVWAFKKMESNADVIDAVNTMLPYLNEQAKKTDGKDTGRCKAAMMEMEFDSKFSFGLQMIVNQTQNGADFANAQFQLVHVQGCAYAMRIIRNKTITDTNGPDADPGLHIDELRLYIGNWKTPQMLEGKGFKIYADLNLAKAKLSIQNMVIVIKCRPALQDEVAAQIDIKALTDMIE